MSETRDAPLNDPTSVRTALLTIAQNRRNFLSNLIGLLLILTITVLGTLWSHFLSRYFAENGSGHEFLIVIPAAVSSLALGGWRLYSRYLDDGIAKMYPQIFRLERELGVPKNEGLRQHLQEILPNSEVNDEMISQLVQDRRIGHRGHLIIDRIALGLIVGFLVVSLVMIGQICAPLKYASVIPHLIGFGLVLCAIRRFQRNPTLLDIARARQRSSLSQNQLGAPAKL